VSFLLDIRDICRLTKHSGLGIGTSPKAFIAHGINTTVVELDPVVYYFATKYFGLPSNHTAVIQNAVPFVSQASAERPASYDYIVHDVFTGGAEPTPLFTLEFLQGLERLLKKDGAIAINYAGDITLPPPRIILNTIFAVFPSCRIYRDTLPSESSETFLNMVVFCTKSVRSIEFRKPRTEDYLGSLARRQFIPPDDELEIKLPDIGGGRKWKPTDLLKQGGEEMVEESHSEAAVRHWRIMRTVLPDEVWENW
jgi:spermidine synthase